MIERTLGFTEPPFSNTPDPKFFFPTVTHQQALHSLHRGIFDRKGFFTLTGDVGTGKTTLCRALLKKLGGDVDTALVLNPDLSEEEILRLILKDFGLPAHFATKSNLMDLLYEFLVERARMGRSALIIIDDAQNLPERSLEQVRMISNFETEKEKLVQILLVGQQEMNDTLDRHEFRQVRQRIAIRAHLRPLTRKETADYIVHRLGLAGGGNGMTYFTSRALKAIFRETAGYPRSVNTLCDHLLTWASRTGLHSIGPGLVRGTARSMRLRRPWKSRFSRHKKSLWQSAAAAAFITLTGTALFTTAKLRVERPSDGRLSNIEKSLAMLEKDRDTPGDRPGRESAEKAREVMEQKLAAAREESEDFHRQLQKKERELEIINRDLSAYRKSRGGEGATGAAGQAPAAAHQSELEFKKTIEVLQEETQIKEDKVRGIEKALDVLRKKLHETLKEKEELARALEERDRLISSAESVSSVEKLIMMEQLQQENDELKRDQMLVENIASQTIKIQGEEIERLTREKQKLQERVKESEVTGAEDSRETTSMVSFTSQ